MYVAFAASLLFQAILLYGYSTMFYHLISLSK